MSATLGAPEKVAERLRALVEAEGLPLRIVTDADCTVRVVEGRAGQASTPTVLQAGGAIDCAVAFQMAARLGVKPAVIGKLADHLDVRIRNCQLGCF